MTGSDEKKDAGRPKKRIYAFVAGFVAAVLCFVVLNVAMAPVSKSDYCGGKCHEMNTAYRTWELSHHGANKYGVRVECVDCHLPPKDKYFRHLLAKGYEGGKDIYKHYLGGEYEIEVLRKRVLENIPNRRCLHCHDDLLARPGSPGARTAHAQVLNPPSGAASRCVDCHENAGHERLNKLFSE
ncbi:MAG: cytochrome c3 family protein [Planctomycetota bacterium]|jgi:cytochrome c-type protein NapC/trimethylamine-N-oxide reductase cytochrome c-type subunit TorC